jgi:hypothetical protein
MENFRRENMAEADIGENPEEKLLNETEKTKKILEGCFYENEESFDSKDLRQLARLESQFNKWEEKKNWLPEKEVERCDLKKKMEKNLSKMTPQEVSKFWKEKEREFSENYGRSRGAEAISMYSSMKSGIINELIAAKALSKVPNLKVEMASSKADIHDKIDFLCIYGNIVLAVQVKNKSRKDMKLAGDQVLENVGDAASEPRKKEFNAGCSAFEKELDLKNRGIELKRIWLIVPSQDKIGDGGEYDFQLGKEIELSVREILGK